MPHTRHTLFLDPQSWDIQPDGAGGIATASGELATAQNAANEVRLFTNDAYFTQDRGIPHFLLELGAGVEESPVLHSAIRSALSAIPDIREILSVTVSDFDPVTRRLSGKAEFSTVEKSSGRSTTTYF